MEHTQIVTAAELEQYADRRDSEAVLPELVWLLVRASDVRLTECRIPYGDTVNQPGWDGLVEADSDFQQFIPQGKSFWEIGTGGKPGNKATDDFKKRTRIMTLPSREAATYVFVTPRGAGTGGWPEPAQTRWRLKREKFGWRRINILDGQKLADWLREFPAVGRWLSKKIGILSSSTGLTTPSEHWECLTQLATGSDASLFHKIFLVGRERACEELSRLFRGEIQQVLLAVESQEDAEDFVAAFLESLNNNDQSLFKSKCLFVKNAETWLSFADLRQAHVLVAHPKIGLESEEQLLLTAKRNRHGIIIPVSGIWSNGNETRIQLRSPSKNMLETALRECGFESNRARELAGIGALSLSALKRHILGLGELPPYATWDNARILAQAGMVGSWQGTNQADMEAIGTLLGKPYGEWIETARELILLQDTPLILRNEKWTMISRGEAWSTLGARLNNDDLDRFKQTALAVLGEKDPRFDLPPEDHYLANIRGKSLSHSPAIRNGFAESLALLGARSDALACCTSGKAEFVATMVVRGLLADADWVTWASLNSQLPLLAEAAPDEFLKALEKALVTPSASTIRNIFAQERTGSFGGGNYITGLLWALEGLAWGPDFLVRVTLILGDLASIDPGGNWANRPINSLRDIFLPWYPQTIATIEKRGLAVEALLHEQPEVGWKTILALLPTGHGTSMGNHKPTWRRTIPDDWKEGTTHGEYAEQVLKYADLAVNIAATDLTKLAELVDRLPDLPIGAHTRVLSHLRSDAVANLSEESRMPLWESLVDLTAKHRKYADSDWAMPSDIVAKIEEVVTILAPRTNMLFNRRLFTERDFDLYEGNDDFEERQLKLEQKRQDAINEILGEYKLAGVLEFAQQVESPRKVGFALGSVESVDLDAQLLPDYLARADEVFKPILSSFVWSRYWSQRWPWVDAQLGKPWTSEQKLAFLILLPFEAETWRRVGAQLGEDEQKYWEVTPVNPWGTKPPSSLIEAAEKLIACRRADAAVDCLYLLAHKKIEFPVALGITALMDALSITNKIAHQMGSYHIQELITWLQDKMPSDSDDLFKVEWAYLPLLDNRFGGGKAKTIEFRLATNPSFYCDVIAAIFHAENDNTEKQAIEAERSIAKNAYRLLQCWTLIPGAKSEGVFDSAEFTAWLTAVKEIAAKSGRLKIAMSQFGEKLCYAPTDPNGLWIHKTIAEALNAKDSAEMRNGFTTGLFNMRGVYSPSRGQGERKLAREYRAKAEALEKHHCHRLADALRDVAKNYDQQAQRDADGDSPFDHL